jgi:hypothetical protein
MLYIEASMGEVEVGEQDSIQPHLIGIHLPNMELTSGDHNWSIFARYEDILNEYTVIGERSYYQLDWNVVGTPNVYSMMVMGGETEPYMYIDRVGVEKEGLPFDLTLSLEHYWLSAYKTSGDSKGYYAMLRKPLGYDSDVFVGYTRGMPHGNPYTDDTFIGVTKDYGDVFVALEYHDLDNGSWSHKKMKNTDSFLFTIGHRF